MPTSLLPSAPRTVETNSPSFSSGSRCFLVVDVTADPAGASITPRLEMLDHASGKWVKLWTAAAAIVAVGTYTYLLTDSADPPAVFGDVTEVAEIYVPPQDLRHVMAVADSDSMTYSVSIIEAVGG